MKERGICQESLLMREKYGSSMHGLIGSQLAYSDQKTLFQEIFLGALIIAYRVMRTLGLVILVTS